VGGTVRDKLAVLLVWDLRKSRWEGGGRDQHGAVRGAAAGLAKAGDVVVVLRGGENE